ncbi:GPI transamidase component gaa1 [Zancudomyces culisetae]|uniref:GPI transamidase component gaa1 n=1 Tax=Zancudomyces culisetae TaxID=1213189 RepID=A0A1R1PX33_ZANCU|nr:GPI transamidase component gaa1 [Zancudomyces culisetae]OMH82917.1 GPI transamidase component gaa1 [Zancudomyces culisetae]OMH85540.1 GPI transamidase component gaa1 [Zancudomyces culisetae]|eukprot:OMH78450.1 GPI transamidase component gaa1 [Zancudomyces culisetae]
MQYYPDSWANELLEIYNEYGIQAEAHSIDDVIDSSTTKKGTVVHAIIRATRSDTVESMVLSVPTRISTDPKLSNANAIELSVALAIHFSEMHIWSKDVVIITSDLGEYGVYKWLQSHLLLDTDNSKGYQKYRVGAIQGAVGLEIPPGTNFDKIGLYYEGKDGQLSNLDLPNTAAIIFGFQNFEALNHGSKSCHKLTSDFEKYKCVFWNLIRGMKVLAFGSNHGTQAPFLEYRIDAISVIAIPRDVDGLECKLNTANPYNHNYNYNYTPIVSDPYGACNNIRSIESLFRSINNLLEHFHQSFFLYLLPDSKRYISIGNYIVPVILMTVAILLKKRKFGRYNVQTSADGAFNAFQLASLQTFVVYPGNSSNFGVTCRAIFGFFAACLQDSDSQFY